MKELRVTPTPIDGLLVLDIPVPEDNRGWFKENWQRAKMTALGLPDFGPVQNNISFNAKRGATRGIHAEPWDKYVSVATGRIFGAWVDLREGPGFGTVFTAEVGPDTAVFVPRGVGNAFQTLEDGTAYTYLVNAHWSPDATYTFLNLADETANIQWPIPLEDAELSEKDKAHPRLSDVTPMAPLKTLVIGANGQLGRALQKMYDGDASVDFVSRLELDISDRTALEGFSWERYGTVINAAAYTAVDTAETPLGRKDAWESNARAVVHLARMANAHRFTLVHVSSDYVFDGTEEVHSEEEALSPLGAYGQSKAAGDLAALAVERHYIVRTSWVIGKGKNFVDTMASLAERGIDPAVVDDQIGRLSFTEDIAGAIRHLLDARAPYGIYNVSNSGPAMSWADIARSVFDLTGADPQRVSGVSTADYFADKPDAAPRPKYSTLDLAKITATGYEPVDAAQRLREHLRRG